ncbi:MAG: hypothetical protein RBT30_02420 [Patescibacteria group bacterium]|jgi:hypothetical protein|nr:hypothetical protein [Patescibacteria group bacterium]
MFKENFISKINKPETNDSESKLLDSVEEQELNKEFSHIEVKEYAKDYFNNLLNSNFLNEVENNLADNRSEIYHELNNELLDNLSILSKSEDEWGSIKCITKNFRAALYIFLEEFVEITKKNENDERVDNFLELTYKIFFSRSPNISTHLDLKSHFDLAAKATRVKKMQPVIGRVIVGELGYRIDQYYDPHSENDALFESFNNGSVSEKLDKINLLGSIYSELIGTGVMHHQGDERLLLLIDKIKESNNNFFIKYYLDILEDNLGNEEENPSRTFFYNSSDPGNSRLWQNLTEKEKKESDLLNNIVIPSRCLEQGEKIIQIAENIVAIADHSNLPIAYSDIDLKNKEKYRSNISGENLMDIKECIDVYKKDKEKLVFDEFIEFCNKKLFIPLENIDKNDTGELAIIWSNFSSISKEDWKEYFDLDFVRKDYFRKLKKYKINQKKELEQKNFQETLKVYEILKTEYPQFLRQSNNYDVNQAYTNFIEAYESGNYEHAFHCYNSLKTGLKYLVGRYNSFSSLINNASDNKNDDKPENILLKKSNYLLSIYDNLENSFEMNISKYEEAVSSYDDKLIEALQGDIVKFNELFKKIKDDKGNVLEVFEAKLDSIIEEERKNKISVNFVSFDNLLKDYGSTLKDFDVNDGELLFQHLYNPAMRRKIEQDFGISFNDLPFHYHIHFLRFLSERDEQEVEKIKEFLNQGNNKENKINKVKSFLSLEFDNSMGVKIVEIGEHFNKEPGVTDMLFSKYVEFVEHLNKNIQNLEDLYKDIFYDKNIDKDKLVKLMMLRANQLLLSAHDKIKSNNSSATELEIKSLLEELDREIANKFKNIEELKDIANDLNHAISLINEEDKNTGSSNQINRIKKALEKKVDQLVYGYDLAQLPKDFTNFENSEVSPEKIPEQAPLYFPVGISKDLPAWESVLKGDMKFAKPIDLYGYLFWLNNQNRKIDLIVCDEIQVNNYQLRFGKTKEESQFLSVKIGEEESKNYQKIIDSFNLSNINIVKYNDFLDSNKENYDHYTQVVEKLKNHPVFEKMFLSMVQESVSGADKAEYLSYANEELAWILSTDGTKVGHLNEARYDILSAVIKNLELFGDKLNIDTINSLDDENVLTILQAIFINLRDIINEKKSKLEKKSSPFLYFQRLQEHLNKINIDKKIKPDKRIKKSDVVLNFSCPDVGSASFGWRGDIEKNESAVKFKEPYSTYFYKSKGDLLTNSDQVVALEDGYISGKILTLEHSKQIEYANNVLKPMLGHYLKTLDNAPLDYFKKVSKDKGELITELNNSQSLLDLLKYIQKYIVQPASQ